MAKTLCDWSKSDFEKHFSRLALIVGTPHFACRKCGRAASESRYLCKPRKLNPGGTGPVKIEDNSLKTPG